MELLRRIDVTPRAPHGALTSIFFIEFLDSTDYAEEEGLLVIKIGFRFVLG